MPVEEEGDEENAEGEHFQGSLRSLQQRLGLKVSGLGVLRWGSGAYGLRRLDLGKSGDANADKKRRREAELLQSSC